MRSRRARIALLSSEPRRRKTVRRRDQNSERPALGGGIRRGRARRLYELRRLDERVVRPVRPEPRTPRLLRRLPYGGGARATARGRIRLADLRRRRLASHVLYGKLMSPCIDGSMRAARA